MSKGLLVALFAAAVLCASVQAGGGDVVTLTQDNFADVVKGNDVVLVEFYAPWCGHCKSLAPEFEIAATELKGKCALGAVDATEEKALASKYAIQGFPTLKIFRGGDLENPSEYNGGRKADEIVEYMKKQTGPSFVELSSEAEVAEHVKANAKAVVGVFASDSEARQKFRAAASALRDAFAFAEIATGAEGVYLYKSGEKLQYTGSDDLATWLKVNKIPLLDAIGPDNYMDYMDAGLPIAWLCVKPSEEAATAAAKSTVTKVAAAFQGKISFVTLDAEEFAQQVETLGLSGEVYPSMAILNETVHFSYDEAAPVDEAGVTAFMNDFLAGKLTPSIRSEKEPETNDGPVTIVVGSSFDRIVLDDTKDVLIEFYAPWCGHCKQLAPIYDKLGSMFKDNDKIVIAKMDATANEAPPQYEIEGFPTIMYFKAGAKGTPLKYNGGRTLDAMMKYIKDTSDFDVNVDITGGEIMGFLDGEMKEFKALVQTLINEKKDLAAQLSTAKAIIKELDAERLKEVKSTLPPTSAKEAAELDEEDEEDYKGEL